MINEKEYKTLIMQENYDSNNTPFCPEFTSIDTVTECMTVITEQTIYEQEGVEILSPSNLTQVYDEVDLLKSSNAYLLLPSKGQIKFSPNLVGEQILYKFKGKSSIYISDCRIWTTLNSNGNVIETLHDVIDDARKIIDFLKQTSDVVNLDVTLKTDIDNAKNITNIMENDIFSANQIDSNLKININSAKNEDIKYTADESLETVLPEEEVFPDDSPKQHNNNGFIIGGTLLAVITLLSFISLVINLVQTFIH
jgi:hypothetical protein